MWPIMPQQAVPSSFYEIPKSKIEQGVLGNDVLVQFCMNCHLSTLAHVEKCLSPSMWGPFPCSLPVCLLNNISSFTSLFIGCSFFKLYFDNHVLDKTWCTILHLVPCSFPRSFLFCFLFWSWKILIRIMTPVHCLKSYLHIYVWTF